MPNNSMNRVIQHLRSAVLRRYGCGLSDSQLLECFIERRDEAAAEMLVRRHGPMVLGVCRRVLRNEADAEDAFQATFLVLVRKAASIRPRDMVGNWLYGVAQQTALRAKVAAAKRWVRERQVTNMPEPECAQASQWSDLVPLLDQELSGLPAKYRSAIVLCDLEGKTYKEAAHYLSCPEGTLSARLARGRTMLAKRLARHGLAVTGATVAALLTEKAASACLPPGLVSSTINVVDLAAAGKLATAGVVSAKVAALTNGVIKTMLLTKLKILSAGLVVVAVSAMSAGVLTHQTSSAEPAERSHPDRPAPMNQNVRRLADVVKVASPLGGVVLFIGTEMQPGEKVPPERLITIQVGGAQKQFRRLKKGDTVKEGQLLARLDDSMARTQLNAKEARLKSSKADADGAKSIADEAEAKLTTANDVFAKRALPLEEWRSAKMTRDKMWYDSVAKEEAAKLAEVEVKQAQNLVASHDIRSGVNGVIVAIHKHPSEAAKKLETILEIEVADTDAAKRAREQATHRLRVPSLAEGIVQFVGSEIKAGEKVPAERLVTVKLGGEVRNFRRLQKGDTVMKGQLLVQIDDRVPRSDVAIKEAKLSASKADADGAKAIADEVESKLATANELYAKRAMPLEEWRSAQLTRDKMWYDAVSKKEAMKLADVELNVSRAILKQYEVRAPANGIIATIRKHPGEAVRELETVIEIDLK